MNLKQTKTRSSNLELYRIIVMLLIVAHHYVVNSELTLVMQEAPYPNAACFSTYLEHGEKQESTALS